MGYTAMFKARRVFIWLLLAAVFAICSPPAHAAASGIIPLEDFFRNPEKAGFQLSPDGEHVAFLQPWSSRLNVYVQKVGSTKVTRITGATARDIGGFYWVNDDRIAYLQDEGGDENFRIYAVNTDGTDRKDLTSFQNTRAGLVDGLRDSDDEILITLNKRDARVFDVYRVNVDTGEMKLVAENPGNIAGWLTDHDGKVRAAVTEDGVNTGLLYRETEQAPFRTVAKTDFRESIRPLLFSYDNRYLYVSSNVGRDKRAVFKYDPATGKELELVFKHPTVDVVDLLSSYHKQAITGVSYVTDRLHYHFFDPERKELQETLEKRLPGYEVQVVSASRDETRMVVRTYSDKSQGAYYFYDLEQGDLQKLAEVSPWLDEAKMAEMRPITFTARDDLIIHGYLTLPRGVKPENLPVVVNPHGGPWARDYWGFRPEVQFLANRGYAVLQMNFRGSTGYGREFWEAGFKEWGRAMQDDITDGVHWLIAEGIADPDRIAIYGGSYGGYATLAGLTFTPELYAAGVDYVGISNIFTLLETIPPYWEPGRQMLYEMIGHPEKDRELLEAVSPVFHAEKIRAPLFIAQGANDPRVKKSESDQMVEALKKKGIDVPYMVKDNEGHGFRNEENRMEFYRAMEEFLAKYLESTAE